MMQSGRGFKRKRGDRTFSHDEGHNNRPSPHRPGNMQLAQQGRESDFRHRQNSYPGGGRPGRGGGRGGFGPRYDVGPPGSSPDAPGNYGQPPRFGLPSSPGAPTRDQPAFGEAVNANPNPHQPAPEDTVSTPSSQPVPEGEPYVYDYITDDVVKVWNDSGRRSIVEAGIQARFDEDAIAVSVLFQELLKAASTNRLDVEDAGTLIKEILQGPPSADEPSGSSLFDATLLFLDSLTIVTETETPPIVAAFVRASGVDPGLMRQHLDVPLLESLGLVRSTFGRMSIRKTTNLLYRQSNYNLLREDSEGYSKLMTELFTTSNNEPPTAEIVTETFERVTALIGAFDLDVGRVLDVVLDVFASVLVKQYRFYVKFLRVSSWWPQQAPPHDRPPVIEASASLPTWALPAVSHWQNSEEEKASLRAQKELRDRATWDRVADVGLKAFFETGRHRIAPDRLPDTAKEAGAGPTVAIHPSIDWIERTTGTLPSSGNRVAAQLLGFKLRFYASETRDASDVLPVNLIYLAALLIKTGFISLEDLYPHLWPSDERMESIKEQKLKEKSDKERLNRPGGGASNALMMAGALPDDTSPVYNRSWETDPSRAHAQSRGVGHGQEKTNSAAAAVGSAEDKDRLPEPSYQKVLLLKSLLCIGALPESLFILGRFPWLPDAFPELLEYIHRLLHFSLDRIYKPLRPSVDLGSVRESKKIPDPPEQYDVPNGRLRLVKPPPRKILRWALPDKDDTTEGTDFRFYWDEWADNLPICQSVDDVFHLCRTLAAFSGVKIGADPVLLVKLVRIGRHSLTEDPSPTNTSRWVDLCKRLLVPALSLTQKNPGVVNEVFDLLKIFPTATRYYIYAEWFSGAVSRLPDIKSAFDQTRAETKDVLKRISKTNIKLMARALAKVTYSSPGVVFAVAIAQIEVYDNLVDVVVECARYFTYLGYDVLTWSLMQALAGTGRDRIQADGMLTSKWLSSLSLFTGRVFKRYSSLMSPTPILQYVAHQLRKGVTVDVVVLRELIVSMAGIIADSNFNDSQVLAMTGGPVLRQQTLLQLLDKRHESRVTAKRLARAMIEPPLAGQILVSIAQVRQTCIFSLPERDAPVKVLGNLVDEIHRALTQYLDLLHSNLSSAEFGHLVPDVVSLMVDFGVDPGVAFWICRPSITREMTEFDKAKLPDVSMEDARPTSAADAGAGRSATSVTVQAERSAPKTGLKRMASDSSLPKSTVLADGDSEMRDVVSSPEVTNEPAATEVDGDPEPWHPTLSSLMGRLKGSMSEETWINLSPSFYTTFWQLGLYDIQVPTKSYEEEVTRLKNKWMAVRDDRSDMSIAGSVRKDRDKKQLTETQDRLRDELKGHIQAFSRTKTRLLKEKDHWFSGFWARWDALNDAIITRCLIPRMLVSPADALYCFKMIKLMHSTGTANFRYMGLINRILRETRLANLLFMCTAREAENLARFLNELLKDLGRWHADKALYEKEAFGVKRDLPGFAKKLAKDKEPESLLGFEDFRRLLYSWHKRLHSALKSCLSAGEYMRIRNAIVVLRTIHQHFPAINWIGQQQVISVTELSKSEKREDLKIAATSLLGTLRRREKQWLMPQAFNLIEAATNVTEGQPSAPSRSATPQQQQQQQQLLLQQQLQLKKAPALSPTAPPFQPRSEPGVNGSNPSTSENRKHEVEEGEIDDTRTKRARLLEQTWKEPDVTTPPVQNPPSRPSLPAPTPASTPTPTPASAPAPAPASASVSASVPVAPPVNLGILKEPTPPPQSKGVLSNEASKDQVSDPRQIQQTSLSPQSQQAPVVHGSLARPAEPSRQASTGNPPPQVPHSLPKRPEVPLPITRKQDWRSPAPERPGSRDLRDRLSAEHGRFERFGEPLREGIDRRSQNATSTHRGTERALERPPPERPPRELIRVNVTDHHLDTAPNDRFGRTPGHEPRSASAHNDWTGPPPRERSGGHEPRRPPPEVNPLPRNSSMAPPRAVANSVQPDRASFGPGEADRWERGRSERADWKGRSSRPPSPGTSDDRRGSSAEGRFNGRREEQQYMGERRRDEQQYHEGRRREDQSYRDERRHDEHHQYRDEHRPSSDQEINKRARIDAPPPPTGPRGDRFGRANGVPDGSSSVYDRPRDSFGAGGPSGPRPMDLDRGRLQADQGIPSRQQDPNYGRLNAAPGPDIPSGPRRGTVGRSSRNVTAPQSGPSTPRLSEGESRNYVASQVQQERPPPTGPSSSRSNHRPGSGQFDHPFSTHSTAPPMSASEPTSGDLVGVHPDRFDSVRRASDTPIAPPHLGIPPPPPPHPTAVQGSRGSQPLPPAPLPPPQQAHSLPPPQPPSLTSANDPAAARNPPVGPASASTTDRSRADKRFAGIQNVLQQGGALTGTDAMGRGVNVRGRGVRSHGMEQQQQQPGGGSGPSTPIHGRAGGEGGYGRAVNGLADTVDMDSQPGSSRGGPTRDGSRDRGESRRYRSHSREPVEHGRRAGEYDRPSRRDDYRDRRSGGGGGNGGGRDDRDSRRGRDRERSRKRPRGGEEIGSMSHYEKRRRHS